MLEKNQLNSPPKRSIKRSGHLSEYDDYIRQSVSNFVLIFFICISLIPHSQNIHVNYMNDTKCNYNLIIAGSIRHREPRTMCHGTIINCIWYALIRCSFICRIISLWCIHTLFKWAGRPFPTVDWWAPKNCTQHFFAIWFCLSSVNGEWFADIICGHYNCKLTITYYTRTLYE